MQTLDHSAARGPGADPTRWTALAVLLAAAVMDLLDGTVVNVAVPAIQQRFGATLSQVQWMIAGYMLSFGLGLITGGRLGDLYGRRRVFLAGVASFTVSSLLAGVATTPAVLIEARVLQGLAAAIMVPQVLAITHTIFPPDERPKAYGLYGAVTGLAAIVGPLIAGLLLEYDPFGFGWRSIFLVNVPIGIVAFALAARKVPESRADHTRRLDLAGVALLAVALLGLLLPLVQGRELGWPWWMIALAVVSLPLFGWFVRHERERTRTDRSPLVPLHLFGPRAFWAGLITCGVFFGVMAGFFITLTITLQLGLGFTALRTGLVLVPFSISAAIGSTVSIAAVKRAGRLVLQFGVGVFAAGLVLLLTAFALRGASITSMALLVPLAVSGFGMGLVIAPLVDVILAGVPERDAGAASGVLNATGQIGQAIGVAAIGAVFFISVGTPSPEHYAHALQVALMVQIAVLLMCILLMALLPKRGSGQSTAQSRSGDDIDSSAIGPRSTVRYERDIGVAA